MLPNALTGFFEIFNAVGWTRLPVDTIVAQLMVAVEDGITREERTRRAQAAIDNAIVTIANNGKTGLLVVKDLKALGSSIKDAALAVERLIGDIYKLNAELMELVP